MNIILDSGNHLPIYEQIIRVIKQAILKGEVVSGDMLPSIRSLASDLEISVITTKRAYEELEKEGLIFSVHGKGFFIKEPNLAYLKEQQLRTLEANMSQWISEASKLGLTLNDMQDILKTLFDGRELK